MVLQYAPLVKYVIGRLAVGTPSIVDFDDLLSAGTVGLIQAVDRYNPDRGVKFETYAISRIRGAIIDSLRALDHLPRSVRQKARQIDDANKRLSATLNRPPSDAEVAEYLGVSLDSYYDILIDASRVTVSLDGLLGGQETTDGAPVPVELDDPTSHDEVTSGIERAEMVEALSAAVGHLPKRERLVVALYYQDEMTMKEISKVLGISESRVCQLHSRALAKLRSALPSPLAA